MLLFGWGEGCGEGKGLGEIMSNGNEKEKVFT